MPWREASIPSTAKAMVANRGTAAGLPTRSGRAAAALCACSRANVSSILCRAAFRVLSVMGPTGLLVAATRYFSQAASARAIIVSNMTRPSGFDAPSSIGADPPYRTGDFALGGADLKPVRRSTAGSSSRSARSGRHAWWAASSAIVRLGRWLHPPTLLRSIERERQQCADSGQGGDDLPIDPFELSHAPCPAPARVYSGCSMVGGGRKDHSWARPLPEPPTTQAVVAGASLPPWPPGSGSI